ncbi:TPA: resolvase [Vibrio vulnificus]|uniref:recombinase family protein n=1 Tax=Vibrio vulnificus TaxID=672 RepID=UPI000542E4AC|nr:recombinase family protein [Vibrio vulnificus]AUL98696.1 site-specific recombinase, resolvase family [Vibrio vulnificus]ELV8742467.1 recombinase family protein [Vibrio vulnificus]KHF82323.1 resolvase [Vibrio vulnificus]KHF82866.1 resolvase [Vibrio vulnificus]MCG6272948.1 recombinase family protein [Vibrio vulnificus]
MPQYAYLRVSSDSQDVANQKHGIYEYCNRVGIANLCFIEDVVTGKKKWYERKLGELIDGMESGDKLIFAEVSRIARSTLQVLEVLEVCMAKGIDVYIAKQNMQLDGTMQAKITATVLGLTAEIEREFISMRTKEALAARKKAGVTLGRPRGESEKLKLDTKREQIEKYLGMGLGIRPTAKLIDEAPSTLRDYIKRRGLRAITVAESA